MKIVAATLDAAPSNLIERLAGRAAPWRLRNAMPQARGLAARGVARAAKRTRRAPAGGDQKPLGKISSIALGDASGEVPPWSATRTRALCRPGRAGSIRVRFVASGPRDLPDLFSETGIERAGELFSDDRRPIALIGLLCPETWATPGRQYYVV